MGFVHPVKTFSSSDFALRGSPRTRKKEKKMAHLNRSTCRSMLLIVNFFLLFSCCSYLVLFRHFSFSFLLPGRNSDPVGPLTRFFSPLPTTVRAFAFYREKTLALSSFVDSHRIATLIGVFDCCWWTLMAVGTVDGCWWTMMCVGEYYGAGACSWMVVDGVEYWWIICTRLQTATS